MRDADKKYEFNFVANLEMKSFWGEQGWGGEPATRLYELRWQE